MDAQDCRFIQSRIEFLSSQQDDYVKQRNYSDALRNEAKIQELENILGQLAD